MSASRKMKVFYPRFEMRWIFLVMVIQPFNALIII